MQGVQQCLIGPCLSMTAPRGQVEHSATVNNSCAGFSLSGLAICLATALEELNFSGGAFRTHSKASSILNSAISGSGEKCMPSPSLNGITYSVLREVL